MNAAELSGLHWSQLRKLVEEKGGTWTNKEEAIALLSGDAANNGIEPEQAPEVAKPIKIAADKTATTKTAFNKDKPYGFVSGRIENAPGARYYQDGKYFNVNGEQVG